MTTNSLKNNPIERLKMEGRLFLFGIVSQI